MFTLAIALLFASLIALSSLFICKSLDNIAERLTPLLPSHDRTHTDELDAERKKAELEMVKFNQAVSSVLSYDADRRNRS